MTSLMAMVGCFVVMKFNEGKSKVMVLNGEEGLEYEVREIGCD